MKNIYKYLISEEIKIDPKFRVVFNDVCDDEEFTKLIKKAQINHGDGFDFLNLHTD